MAEEVVRAPVPGGTSRKDEIMARRTAKTATPCEKEMHRAFAGAEEPDPHRRLSDKILEAFVHAYSVGEAALAKDLKAALDRIDGKRRQNGCGPGAGNGAASAVERAERWVNFVEARNVYARLTGRNQPPAAKVEEARERMNEAYREWCQD